MNSSSKENITIETMAGGKRRVAQRKTTAGSLSKSKSTSKSSSQKKGGAVIDDIKNLAVPFAILLAKQGVQSLFDSKANESVGISASPKKSVKSSSKSSSRKQEGGSCVTCQGQATAMNGGASSKQTRSTTLKKNYVSLAKKIDEFLSKY